MRGAIVSTFGAPPIDGLGTTGGFKLIIEDRGNLGLARSCSASATRSSSAATRPPGLQGLFNSSRANTPWLYLDIDRTKCMALGVPVSELFNTLQVYLGSYYVNNFNQFGRTWQVNIQADQRFRGDAHDIRQLQVRNNQGQMIRLATLMDVRNTSGPVMVMRYNMYSAAAITGNPAPGTSSGQAIALMQEIAAAGIAAVDGQRLDRAGVTCSTRRASTATGVFGLAVVFVFLVLAAQYESWKLPLAVILVVPMCLLCSIVGVNLAGMDVSMFTQIGFVVLVGLASKNAILIVEFAKQPGGGCIPPRGHAGSLPAAAAADPDDLVRLHLRRRAAGARRRRRRRDAALAGHGRLRRHAGRDRSSASSSRPVFYYVIQSFGDEKRAGIHHEITEHHVPASEAVPNGEAIATTSFDVIEQV